jgi:hypothetical protein
MDVAPLLLELFGRIPPLAHDAVDGLDAVSLAARPDQLWVTDGWAERFGLAADPENTGYGHHDDEVATVRPEGPDVLLGYLAAVDARTRGLLGGLSPHDLDRIVDERWDPPVTLGVRLVSVADDCLQHLGQANYVRGLLAR